MSYQYYFKLKEQPAAEALVLPAAQGGQAPGFESITSLRARYGADETAPVTRSSLTALQAVLSQLALTGDKSADIPAEQNMGTIGLRGTSKPGLWSRLPIDRALCMHFQVYSYYIYYSIINSLFLQHNFLNIN